MDWGEYFMRIAAAVAEKSKDPSAKVGAIIVDEDHTVRVTGFNGPPRGVRDSPDRLQKPEKYLWVSHAEMNCIAQAARVGVSTKDCTLVVTHAPCNMCARLIVQAGIRRLIIGAGATSVPREELDVSAVMFEEADVQVWKLNGCGGVEGA